MPETITSMRKFSILLSFAFCLMAYNAFTQNSDTALVHELLKDIAASQVKTDGEFFAGMFPSYREVGGIPHNYQPDNNIFFTAISAFTLRNLLPQLSGENKETVEKIIAKAASCYPEFEDQFGQPFYNFWPTHAPIMPHTYYFKYLKGVFGQGEDADDTVMILMTSQTSDSILKIVKSRLEKVSNKSEGRQIISAGKQYRDFAAYSTYLGLRMTPDFDFAVQCNIMYFILDKHLTLERQDSATIQLLAEMVKNRAYMKAPVFISPYYVKTSILLYHLTRLMGAFKIPELEVYKKQIISDIYKELENPQNIMDAIILRTSLLRLGAEAPSLAFTDLKAFEKSNQKNYVFFQARAAFSYPVLFKQIFLHWSYINYYFFCPAYNKILYVEYLIEKQKYNR